jgi:hypothetical protein
MSTTKRPRATKRVRTTLDVLHRRRYDLFALTTEENAKLRHALQLHIDFLDSLPRGWLGRTVADIGLLNDAYLASRAVGVVSRKER